MTSRLIGISSFVLASPFTDNDTQFFKYAREIGFEVFEVCVEDPAQLSAEPLIEAANGAGLQISVCGAFGPDRDVSHEEPDKRAQGLRYLKGCIDLAADVGSPHVAGPMYSATGKARLLPAEQREQQRTWAAESLREAADYAGERGVRLAMEPLNRFETDLVNTVEQGLDLCDRIGRANVGLLLDTFHMNIEEKSFAEAMTSAGDRLFHMQVAENDRGTPGSGHVPWDEVFRALDAVGYNGSVVIESFLPTVAEIARAVSLWRPVAPSMDALARDGHAFIRACQS
ncbi:MAG: sugar phosphate isomerase/epimerase family protein [Acidimicrobiales bacterium]